MQTARLPRWWQVRCPLTSCVALAVPMAAHKAHPLGPAVSVLDSCLSAQASEEAMTPQELSPSPSLSSPVLPDPLPCVRTTEGSGQPATHASPCTQGQGTYRHLPASTPHLLKPLHLLLFKDENQRMFNVQELRL